MNSKAELVISLINEVLKDSEKPPVDLDENTILRSSGLLSSLELFSVVLLLEERGISIHGDHFDKIDTVADIIKHMPK